MIRRVGIVAKPGLTAAASNLSDIARWLQARGVEPVFESATAEMAGAAGYRQVSRDDLPRHVELVLVLGGDGTMLGMADRVAQAGLEIPILGVNFGGLGFLTEITLPELFPSLEAALANQAAVETRLMLQATVERGGALLANRPVLNDVVVTGGELSRIIEFSVTVGDEFVARFNADGIIIATPTGSTAYNLSAGGPIVHPAVDAFVLNPIAPHTLTNRPVVIPASTIVMVQPHVIRPESDAFVTFDGQDNVKLLDGDLIRVQRAPRTARLVRASTRGHYQVLREKLKWSER